MDYVFVNEVVGRSEVATVALGTHSLQDSIMLHRYASDEWRDKYLRPLVDGEVFPSFGMTEPDVASSDPTQLQTRAELEGDEWVINGRKWFTSGAGTAAYTTAMVRTEPEGTPDHSSFSMIVVPTDTPGYSIIRDVRVMGQYDGHYEVVYDDVRVPKGNLLGPRGQGFKIAQQRLGPGRIFHCMRWLGQAQRGLRPDVRAGQRPGCLRQNLGGAPADSEVRLRLRCRNPSQPPAHPARRPEDRPG